MKKITLIFLSLVMLTDISISQNATTTTTTPLFDFNKSRNKRTNFGLKALGVWSIANVGYSSYGYYNSHGSEEYFHNMNVLWNSVNIAIVAGSLLAPQKNDIDLMGSVKAQHSVETIYISNAVLDLVYSSVGLYLTEKAKNDIPNADKWNGWGNSLIMQGGFLFLLDTTMFAVHKHNGKKLYKILEGSLVH